MGKKSKKESDFKKVLGNVRKKFEEIATLEKSVRRLSIEWAIETYTLKCEHFIEETVKKGLKAWVFEEEMEEAIAPFKSNISKSPKRLPSTALVQFAQMESPLKTMKEPYGL